MAQTIFISFTVPLELGLPSYGSKHGDVIAMSNVSDYRIEAADLQQSHISGQITTTVAGQLGITDSLILCRTVKNGSFLDAQMDTLSIWLGNGISYRNFPWELQKFRIITSSKQKPICIVVCTYISEGAVGAKDANQSPKILELRTSNSNSHFRQSVNNFKDFFLLGRYGTLSCLPIYFHRAQFGGIQPALTIQYLRTANWW